MPAAAGFTYDPSAAATGKAGTVSLPTPIPMSVNPDTAAEINGEDDYKNSVNGVVPGYAGHMPRSRDKYAGSAHGGIANPYTPPDAKGPQKGCTRAEDVIPSTFASYIQNVNGVMPGYTGYRPKSHDVFNVTAFGGIPTGMDEGMHERAYDWQRAPKPGPPSFRDSVGGILPGYTGFVPAAIDKHGTSHYGKTRPTKAMPQVPLAQAGHEEGPQNGTMRPWSSKETSVAFGTMPGYQGHIPQARDAFGTSYHSPTKQL